MWRRGGQRLDIDQAHRRARRTTDVERPRRRLAADVPPQTEVVRLAGIEVWRPWRDDEAVLERARRRQTRILEAAVLHQLGVEAAVTGVADLLEKDPIKRA